MIASLAGQSVSGTSKYGLELAGLYDGDSKLSLNIVEDATPYLMETDTTLMTTNESQNLWEANRHVIDPGGITFSLRTSRVIGGG